MWMPHWPVGIRCEMRVGGYPLELSQCEYLRGRVGRPPCLKQAPRSGEAARRDLPRQGPVLPSRVRPEHLGGLLGLSVWGCTCCPPSLGLTTGDSSGLS